MDVLEADLRDCLSQTKRVLAEILVMCQEGEETRTQAQTLKQIEVKAAGVLASATLERKRRLRELVKS